MNIENKPIESLKIQTNNFLNYIWQSEKYWKIIHEVICMDNDEFEKHIQNTEEMKSFLISKWIQEELINNFENEYKKYILSDKYYYGSIDKYPENSKESIENNDKIMKKIKWFILSINKNKELLDIPEFVEKTIKLNPKNTNMEENDYNSISEIIFKIHDDYSALIKNIYENIEAQDLTGNTIHKINGKIKSYIIGIKNLIENNPVTVDSKTLEFLKENINKFFNRKTIKKTLINIYTRMYFHWDNPTNSIQLKNSYIPTIYTKNIFDTQILNEMIKEDFKIDYLINRLWNNIDNEFIDDIFIHQSDFRILEDVINEWWLISSNELVKRSKNNDRINRTKNSYPTAHIDKDIFFTRWFTNYEYWHSKKLEDVVYFANTMRQFWSKWYPIPINADTQNSYSTEIWSTKDSYWYSIISKSALEDKDSYSKIKTNDLYIFVHESKKQAVDKILSNLRNEEKDNIHIIYIPDDIYPKNPIYKTNNTYRITEFIRNYLDTHINNKPGIRPINKIDRSKIIENNFYNIDVRYNIRAECESIGEEDCPKKYNELKDTDDELLAKIYQKYFWKETNINPKILNKIWDINSYIENYPSELIKISAMLISWNIDEWGEKLKDFFVFLRKKWYSQKDISILWFIHDFMLLANWSREANRREKYWWLWKFCNNWDINYDKMKNLLIDLWNILDIEKVWEIIEAQENWKLIGDNIY